MSGTEQTTVQNAFYWRDQPSQLVEKESPFRENFKPIRQARIVRHVDAVSTVQVDAYSRATPAKVGA